MQRCSTYLTLQLPNKLPQNLETQYNHVSYSQILRIRILGRTQLGSTYLGSLKWQQSDVDWRCSHRKAWPGLGVPLPRCLTLVAGRLDWLLAEATCPLHGMAGAFSSQAAGFPPSQGGKRNAFYDSLRGRTCSLTPAIFLPSVT